jgi:hypothetical protein
MFKWKFSNPFGRRTRKNITKKIVLGICALDKKTKSKPMGELLDRLPADLFEIKIFGDECILNEPIESWPVVEVLITFYSTKFPTEKALEYIKLRKPFLINDLSMESTLQDRRKVYNLLEQCGIDVPHHIFVSRDEEGNTYDIEEFDEYIVINGEQLNKPFVEKPVYAEDHNIYIYYPISAGGGSKRLFRKVQDKSAEFYPNINEIRREGSYIYEEFVTTQGTDVKVYTVGPEYGHAEARKSPVVDGRVKRDSEGREVRYPVILSPTEKEMARKIVQAFRQTVCGFDILRVQGKSYCCDVNGFSFVKNSRKYYEDAAQILAEIMLNNLRQEFQIPQSLQIKRAPSPAPSLNASTKVIRNRESSIVGSDSSAFLSTGAIDDISSSFNGNRPPSPFPPIVSDFEYGSSTVYSANQRRYETEDLRSVIAIIRHGDRTPKQKIKVVICEQRYLDYFHSYVKTPKKDLKVKSKSGLVKFLEVTCEIIHDRRTNVELRRKLVQLRDVLERWEISGINRKLQMKPQKWDEDDVEETEQWVEVDDDIEVDSDIVGSKTLESSESLDFINVNSIENHRTMEELLSEPKISATIPASLAVVPPITDTDDNGYMVGTAFSTPSFATKMRRRQLVKTKKVIREGTGLATEILVILKWGGDLTPLGREQAEKLGERFRNENYPDHDNGGVLRLHATYRHDLKIKASDEGRVMKTAAAFTKGLLELEGQLTPILASLVTIEEKNRTMLDRGGNFEMKEEMDRCKKHLNMLQVDQVITDELIEQIVPGCSEATRRAFHDLENPLEKLRRMHFLIDKICTQLEFLCVRREESGMSLDDTMVMTDYILPASGNADLTAPSPLALNMVGINIPELTCTGAASTPYVQPPKSSQIDIPNVLSDEAEQPPPIRLLSLDNSQSAFPGAKDSYDGRMTNPPTLTSNIPSNMIPPDSGEDLSFMNTLYLNETFDLMLERWKKLHKDLYSSKTGLYDLTKLPDVYDMIRYDILHNQHLNFTGMDELYELAKKFELVVVPQEYGIDAADKRYIGSKMCGALLEKIQHDLTIASGVDSGLNNQDPMLFQLDHSHADDLCINSIGRVVRTRLYFTSESHLHTILNVFRYPKPNSPYAFGKEAMEKLEEITNVSYLSQIVIRLFEDRVERGKFSCELSFSSGSTQHDPAVMTTTTLPLDSPYLLAPYVYLDKSLDLFQLLGCLDDAIELYHNTDKHTTNAMLLAASSSQFGTQAQSPVAFHDGLETREIAIDASDPTQGDNTSPTNEQEKVSGSQDSGAAHDKAPIDGTATDMDAGDKCITPPPSTYSSLLSSSKQRSMPESGKKYVHPFGSGVPSSAASTRVKEEVVDTEPDPAIDSKYSTPIKGNLRTTSLKMSEPSSHSKSAHHKPPLLAEKNRTSIDAEQNMPRLEDLPSPLPMRRNYSVTVNIDEASDNWERLEKSLNTAHHQPHRHNQYQHRTAGNAGSGTVGGAGGGGTATSISRSRQHELDLLTRRAVASQLQQQSSSFTSAATAAAVAATTVPLVPLRVPAKRVVSLDSAIYSTGSSLTTTAAALSAWNIPSMMLEAIVPTEVSHEQQFVAEIDQQFAVNEQKQSSNRNSGRWPESSNFTKVAVHSSTGNEDTSCGTSFTAAAVAPSPITATPNASSLPSSRKRTDSLSADNIFLLDRVGQERDRASSELGLVSDARVSATTPTQSMGEVAVSAGMNTVGKILVVESSSEGMLTVFKPQQPLSATPSGMAEANKDVPAVAAVAAVAANSQPKGSSTDRSTPSVNAVPAPIDVIDTAAGAVSSASSSTSSSAGPTTHATGGGGDVIVVQRSLSDIENRRLKDSLFLVSDFYLPLASSAIPTPTAHSQSQSQSQSQSLSQSHAFSLKDVDV